MIIYVLSSKWLNSLIIEHGCELDSQQPHFQITTINKAVIDHRLHPGVVTWKVTLSTHHFLGITIHIWTLCANTM